MAGKFTDGPMARTMQGLLAADLSITGLIEMDQVSPRKRARGTNARAGCGPPKIIFVVVVSFFK